MKNTDFDYQRIAQGYKNRPFLHRQVIEQFQKDTGRQQFALGLDIGCGAGLSTKALKAICTHVVGTDISPEMIRVAREVCAQDEDITYLVSSAEELSPEKLLENQKAEIVTAAGAIQWIDRDLFLSNMSRIIRENGYLLIYDFAISDTMPGNPAYTDWWHNQYLTAFPRPYRNESMWKKEDTAPYGFRMIDQADLKMEYSFDLETFIEFMMIQSNVNARIDKDGKNETAVYQWFRQTLAPIFHDQTQRLLFKGYSWYFQFASINMKEKIKQILPLWGIENKQLEQIYPSAWEIDHSYVIKVYDNQKHLERNIRISEILSDCNIPVAKILPIKTGKKYAAHENVYFLMSEKLQGCNISDLKDKTMARKMGCAIAQLHAAFTKCENEVEFWDNSLLKEMKGWVRENLAQDEWKILSKEEYDKTVGLLENRYDHLPRQLIHRDVHFGNFLFFDGNLSGYIDFDLSQRNIRIFDICYFLAGLLAEETDDAFTRIEWIENIKAVIAGYESIIRLSETEKSAVPYVMECIEILFIAYYISLKDTKQACDAYNVFRFIQSCERDIKNVV